MTVVVLTVKGSLDFVRLGLTSLGMTVLEVFVSCRASLDRTDEASPPRHAKTGRDGDPGVCPHVDVGGARQFPLSDLLASLETTNKEQVGIS